MVDPTSKKNSRQRSAPSASDSMLRKLWRYRSTLNDWDFYVALLLASTVTKFTPRSTIVDGYASISFAFIGVLAAILSFTIAGAAIVATLMSPSFAALLRRTPDGIGADLFPFWWLSAVCSWGVIACFLAVIAEARMSVCEARFALGIQSFFVFYVVLATLGLVALTIGQAENHAIHASTAGD
jgi:hypothetical protein